MTILHVYNLYDSTIETYTAQFLSTHDKLMKRECEALFNQAKNVHSQNPVAPQGALYRYADSYQMMHTADFDDQIGVYTMLDVPYSVCNFAIFLTQSTSKDMTDDEKAYAKSLSSSLS